MREFFLSGGILMWPLLVIAIGVVVLALRASLLLARDAYAAETEQRLHSILFWGGMSVVLGLLGTTIGLTQMAQAIRLAGGVEPPLVWGGFAVALVTLIFGLLIFLVAALLWFVLRQWSRSLVAHDRRNLPAA